MEDSFWFQGDRKPPQEEKGVYKGFPKVSVGFPKAPEYPGHRAILSYPFT